MCGLDLTPETLSSHSQALEKDEEYNRPGLSNLPMLFAASARFPSATGKVLVVSILEPSPIEP